MLHVYNNLYNTMFIQIKLLLCTSESFVYTVCTHQSNGRTELRWQIARNGQVIVMRVREGRVRVARVRRTELEWQG